MRLSVSLEKKPELSLKVLHTQAGIMLIQECPIKKRTFFLAEDIIFTKQKLDEAESGMKVKKIKISEIENFIKKGKIRGQHAIDSFYIYKLRGKK